MSPEVGSPSATVLNGRWPISREVIVGSGNAWPHKSAGLTAAPFLVGDVACGE
jgi:hypothetical protein